MSAPKKTEAPPVVHAPKEIKPVPQLSGRSGVIVRRKPATAPDWAFWPAVRPVAPWQAAALSLGLDPDSLDMLSGGWMGGPGAPPSFKPESFSDAEIEVAHGKRLALIGSFVSHSARVPLGELAGVLSALPSPPEFVALVGMVPAPVVLAAPVETEKVGAGRTAKETGRTEPRIAAIIETVHAFKYEPLAIPWGGKAMIERECLAKMRGKPWFFTEAAFKRAWQAARDGKLIDVESCEIYKGQ